jgi:hypothetical protein
MINAAPKANMIEDSTESLISFLIDGHGGGRFFRREFGRIFTIECPKAPYKSKWVVPAEMKYRNKIIVKKASP